jgi:hypothetical protein
MVKVQKQRSLHHLFCVSFLLAVLVVSGCPGLLDSTDDADGGGGSSVWAPAATLFKLEGESSAANVKLTWLTRSGADRYEVYRDGVRIARSSGDTIDDYGLNVGQSYSYTVKAYSRNMALVASSSAATVTPFNITGALQGTWDNDSGSPSLGSGPTVPSGWNIGGTYYDFRFTGSGSGIKPQQRSSSTGLSGWTSWADLPLSYRDPANMLPLTDAKLEASETHRIGDKVVVAAHREPFSGYTLGHFFLASFTPDVGAEVTFDDKPFGYDSRDCSTFTDTDGVSYALGSSLSDVGIYQMNSDWTELVKVVNIIAQGQRRETPSIRRVGDTYYFFSSKQSGWYPSQAAYATAKRLDGQWTALLELGNAATFGAQYNRVTAYGSERETLGMYAYRWAANWAHAESGNPQRLMTLTLNNGCAAAEYFSKVEYYPTHGLIGVQQGRNLSRGMLVTPSVATTTNAAAITDGADMASSPLCKDGSASHALVIDLKTPAVIKEIHLTTQLVGGSEGAFKYIIAGSANNTAWTNIVTQSSNWRPGFMLDKVTNTSSWRYIRITVSGVLNVSNGDANIKSWADGIIEMAVYGIP